MSGRCFPLRHCAAAAVVVAVVVVIAAAAAAVVVAVVVVIAAVEVESRVPLRRGRLAWRPAGRAARREISAIGAIPWRRGAPRSLSRTAKHQNQRLKLPSEGWKVTGVIDYLIKSFGIGAAIESVAGSALVAALAEALLRQGFVVAVGRGGVVKAWVAGGSAADAGAAVGGRLATLPPRVERVGGGGGAG